MLSVKNNCAIKKSPCQFTCETVVFLTNAEALCSSEVVSDRSGNERAVRMSKLYNLISNGMHSK